MAFRRKIEMQVGNVLISDLYLTFDITRTLTLSSNSATFSIYNAKKNTRNDILRKGNIISFKAGYEDENNMGLIFVGTIIDSVSRKEGTEIITDITAIDFGSNKQGLTFNTISLSYAANTPVVTIISDIITFLNIAVAGLSNVTGTLKNGFVYAGNVNNLLKRIEKILKSYNLGVYFDSSEMVIFRLGQIDSTFEVVSISPNNGLIGNVEGSIDENDEKNKKRVRLVSLLNPRIRPNTVINITNTENAGNYITEKVRFYGDNFGGDFFCEMEAVE